MEVGGEVDGSGEDALLVLAFGLAVELFPPFGEEVELGVEVDEDFNFFAGAVECVACHGVCCGEVSGVGVDSCALHGFGTVEESADVVAGDGYGKEAYGG